MKLQLDTENKTIKLESTVELAKLVETLESLLPNGKWKEFTLQTNTTITYWQNPIVIEKYVSPRPYWQPWYRPYYTASNKSNADYKVSPGSHSMQLKSGVYNVEV